ncbi:hypothetical protein MHU86_7606 [Fragilaria crotonensis]|nr:hypothetical protein MHU86_7606 [Fragilaria crotonensis]
MARLTTRNLKSISCKETMKMKIREQEKRRESCSLLQQAWLESVEGNKLQCRMLNDESVQPKKTPLARTRWYTDPVTRIKPKKTPKMSAWWEDYIQDPKPED